MSRFLARHPGVKRSLVRGAIVGAIGGGLAVAGFRNRKAVRLLLQHELPIIRARRSVIASLERSPRASRGLKALVRSLEKDTRRLKKHTVRVSRRSARQLWGAGSVGGVGAAWAAVPGTEDLERYRERREASRLPGFQVFTKRRRAA